jgi:HEAT repeat protein
MRRAVRLASYVAVFAWLVPPAHAADEPFWNSRPLTYWLDQLRVGDASARTEAARSVAEIALAHGSRTVAAAVPLLMPCLDATDAPLRAAAADALAPMGAVANHAGPRLLDLFERDPDPDVRRAAGVAVARVVPASDALVSVASRVLRDDGVAGVRQAAAAALVEADVAARPALSSAEHGLADGDALVRVYAAAVVARVGNHASAVPVLLEGLKADDPAVRAESAGLIADRAPGDQAAVPTLIAALRDPERQVRVAAADALAVIGPPARAAVEPLWHLIRDPDEDVRESALKAIRLIKE